MRRDRFRTAGAMLLMTLLLSFAEAAWAATCDPDMRATPDSSMAWMPDMDPMPAGHECPPGHGHEHDGTRGADPDCPFAPAGGFGCTASASLPGVATHVIEPVPVRVLRQRTGAVLAHDLHAHSIFHPPKV